MVYQNSASYLWIKGQTYYFNRRVPKDIQPHYSSSRIVICLKTSRRDSALRSAKSIAQRLEDYWMSLRLANIDISKVDGADIKADWGSNTFKGQRLAETAAIACKHFSNVLTPETDRAHHDHFHLDTGLGVGCVSARLK